MPDGGYRIIYAPEAAADLEGISDAIGAKGWGEILGGYIAPTLLGNVIGGVTLVAALNDAQVVAGGGGGGEDV